MAEIIKYEEQKLLLPMHTDVTSARILSDGSSVEIVYKVPVKINPEKLENVYDFFPIVRVSELALNKDILAYTPETEKQTIF